MHFFMQRNLFGNFIFSLIFATLFNGTFHLALSIQVCVYVCRMLANAFIYKLRIINQRRDFN